MSSTRRGASLAACVLALGTARPAAGQDEEGAGRSDHEQIVGDVGLGYLGYLPVPAALPHPTEAVVISPDGNAVVSIVDDEVVVPLFGLRYWFVPAVGAELGLGLNVESGGETVNSPNPDPAKNVTAERTVPSTLAFAARLGVPISLYHVSHFDVLLLPQIDVGYTQMTLEAFDVSTAGDPLDLTLSGFSFGAGARLGAEMSFGFLGVPQLWLQAAWGVRFESLRRSGQIGDAETSRSSLRFGSSWYREPWDVFLGGFSLLYYL